MIWRKLVLVLTLVGMLVTPAGLRAQDGDHLPLSQTYRSGDRAFRFAYPAGWVIREREGTITLATDEDALDARFDALDDDQFQVFIRVGPRMEGEPDLSEPVSRVILTRDRAFSALIAVDVGYGMKAVIGASSVPDEQYGFWATLRAVIETFEYFPPDALLAEQNAAWDRWQDGLRSLPDSPRTVYTVVVPKGDAPPGGWPLLVVLHGGGGLAQLERFGVIAEDSGVLLVVVENVFSGKRYEQIVPTVAAVIEDVRAAFPVDARGAVLHGSSASASLVTLYAQERPGDVIGVVAENGPVIFAHPPGHPEIAYAFVYGEVDGGYTAANQDRIAAMQEAGHAVTVEIVPEVGHVFTVESVELTFEMIRRQVPVVIAPPAGH